MRFGVESAVAPAGSQPLEALFYTLDPSLTFAMGNLVSIGPAVPITVSDSTLAIEYRAVVPNDAFDASQRLVVELHVPDGSASTNMFLIGSNALGETAPTYLGAASCSLLEPMTLASIGFPGMHAILDVEVDEATDSDGDGVPDGQDSCVGNGAYDSDGDTICDGDDVHLFVQGPRYPGGFLDMPVT